MLKALFIGLALLTVMLSVIYKIFIYDSISEEKAKKKLIRKEERERNLEEKRILELKIKREKHENRIKEIAQEVIQNQANLLEDCMAQAHKRMNYDYTIERKKTEEHKGFYEERRDKLVALNDKANNYFSLMEKNMSGIADWLIYDHESAQYILEEMAAKGMNMVEVVKRLYNDAVFYKRQLEENIKEAEKLAEESDFAEKTRKQFKKELMKFSNIATKFEDYRCEIDQDIIECDAVLVSEKGIFVLFVRTDEEGKHRKIYISEREEWYTEGYDIKERIKGVGRYSHKKIEVLQRWINQAVKSENNDQEKYFSVYPLIIVMDNEVKIENQSYLTIIKMEELFNHINFFKSKEIEKHELNKIIDILNKNKTINEGYDLIDNSQALKENLEIYENSYHLIHLIHEICFEFCRSSEKDTKIKIYRRYLSIKTLLKWKKEIAGLQYLEKKLTPNYVMREDSDKLLYNFMYDNIEESVNIPLKIVANICDISYLKMEGMVKSVFKIEEFSRIDRVSFKAINQSLAEIIIENFSQEKLKDYMIMEKINGMPFYRFKYFLPQ